MWILGVTGALGAGKSTLSKYLEREGVPVHSADQEVHRLFREDKDIQREVKSRWPEVFVKGKIDRLLLGEKVLSSEKKLHILEGLLYPKVAKSQKEFLLKCQKERYPMVALDVPLLVEVGLNSYCHRVLLASAPEFLRKERALRRKGMTEERFSRFESHQLSENDRRKCADFVIRTGRDKGNSLKQVKQILAQLRRLPPPTWTGKWPHTLKRKSYG